MSIDIICGNIAEMYYVQSHPQWGLVSPTFYILYCLYILNWVIAEFWCKKLKNIEQ